MCKVLGVNRSGYYKWLVRKSGQRVERNSILLQQIKAIYQNSKGRYGSPRITKELNMQGVKVSKVLVAKLMRRAHIRSIVHKKYRITTHSLHQYDLVENVLARDFTAKKINQK